MRRRTRSPKGARGGASTGTRGGRGRGRARGGAKGRSERGGGGRGKSVDSHNTGNSNASGSDCVDIILKDNHRRNNITSTHFSRTPNGSVSYGRERELQLGSVPRRPLTGPVNHNGNNNNSSNNNMNNNGGNDFYLHKKFKKMTATVDAIPSTSNDGGNIAASGNGNSAEASSGIPSSNSSSSCGMVYKPKFRIKSDLEDEQSAQEEQPSTSSKSFMPLLSPRERSAFTSAASALDMLRNSGTCSDASDGSDMHISLGGKNSVILSGSGCRSVNSGSLLVSSKHVVSPTSLSSGSTSNSNMVSEPARISKGLDRKSLDDRISKIIDENQSILEWPEQFTKMLKNHTSRGQSQNPQQRTSHLLSGGSTTELPASSPSASSILSHFSQHNGIIRHSSTSSEMSTSGGSVELLSTSHHHSLLNSNGLGISGLGSEALSFKNSLSNSELHSFSISGTGGSITSPVHTATDLTFGAHNSGSTVTIVRPSSASSTGSASSSATSSSMVPKKRRRLSPTPNRLCGGEVSELPVNEPSGTKNYFQDVDMTVRVSNCSGAKVTIRTNNGAVSGGSVQTASPGIITPVDFTKIIDHVASPHHSTGKPVNGAIFFPGPGPSSPSTILSGNKPLSLVSTNKRKSDALDNFSKKGSLLISKQGSESQKPQKSPRGRPPRKKSVTASDSTPMDCSTSSLPSSSSLLRVIPPSSEIPCRPSSGESILSPKLRSVPLTLTTTSLSAVPLLAVTQSYNTVQEPITTSSLSISLLGEGISRETEQRASSSAKIISPRESPPKSENSNPEPETPFQVVPTPTQNPKRPTFLALKPVNTNSKKTEGVLPSPETPRVAKPYNQMTINGQAYTYLGFKVSTRSSYTCLFKTQPMFIPQDSDPKLSMYTNWQPRPRDPNQLQIGISTNDSRRNGRKSPHNMLYTSAYGKNGDTLTVSSPDNHIPISSPLCESKTFLSGIEGRSSESDIEEPSCSTSTRNLDNEPIPSTSGTALQSRLTQPIKIQVSSPPSSNSGIVPISPPSKSSSPVSFMTSNSPAVGSGGLMSIAALSPKQIGAMNLSSRETNRRPRPTTPNMSSSDTNSMDEPSGGFSRRQSILRGGVHDDDGESNLSEEPMALTSSGDGNEDPLRYDSHRVKIMEGGFESNEDYTYVRGRGRGRYVCEACGIRCKKPSMLRKHLKTHTDLRPYTCKLCNFSFKTKGNLTKHQKSKSHHKKCAGLGIHPESSTSLAMTGPAFSISDTNTTDDNDSDDDFDENGDLDGETDSQDECEDSADADGHDNGSESFEKEIAQSLLDLSKATVRLPSGGSASSDYESSNDAAKLKNRQPTFPYSSMIEDISNSSAGSYTTATDSTPAPEIPIDLSVKPVSSKYQLEPEVKQCESESKRIKVEKNGLIKAIGVVKEAEAWEPTTEDASRCLNLKRVLNSETERQAEAEVPELRIPEVKIEVPEFPSGCERDRGDARLLFGQRQRTESETSNASNSSFPTISILPVMEGTSGKQHAPPIMSSSIPANGSSSASSSNTVKLHQPWLSPSESKDKKEGSETVPPAIEVRPLPNSSDASTIPPFKSAVDELERDALANSTAAPSTEPGLGGMSSPNSKLFSGLSAIKPQAEFRQPSGPQALRDEGKAECNVCGKTFARASQLTLHMNIHYIERPFRCDPCGVSFRTKGHLIKHRRSSSHDCKVYLTEAWGVANEENPRPFKCPDCKIAFRIHGHLAKHLRSKMHIMRMECLGKLPFGIYFEMEKSGINLNEIDTTDCDMSLVSLQNVARKIYGDQWRERLTVPVEEPSA